MEWKHLNLKRIVKENHGCAISQLAFPNPRHSILATVSSTQINFYDNEHIGDHLDIISQYNGHDLRCLAWISLPDDLLLCTASQNVIHVFSLTRSREIKRLCGHAGLISDLASLSQAPNWLLSTSQEDGTSRLWHLNSPETSLFTLSTFSTRSVCIFISLIMKTFHLNGTSFYTATTQGVIHEWPIPMDLTTLTSADLDFFQDFALETTEDSKSTDQVYHHHQAEIDALVALSHNRLLSKSIDNTVILWQNLIPIYKIDAIYMSGRLAVSLDESLFCVGTLMGGLLFYDIETGECVHQLKHKRSTKSIRCCAFTSKSVLCVDDDSVLWRYDVQKKEL
jgi:WD40 repeat protein